jgi:integrase
MQKRKGYLIKRGGTFYAVWKSGGVKHVKTTRCTTEREALRELDRLTETFVIADETKLLERVKAEIEHGKNRMAEIEDAKNPALTLDRAWAAYERSPSRPDSGDSTLKQYGAELRRFQKWMIETHPAEIKDHPEQITMRGITSTMATEYAQDLTADKVSASTFNQHVKFLALLWRVLSDEIKGGAVNPWEGIATKRLNAVANRKRALTPAQFDALTAAAESDSDVLDLILILAWTGLRLVDAVKLTWGAVDFARNVISVTPQKTARRTGKTVYIPMFPVVKGVLNQRQSGKVLQSGRAIFRDLVESYDRDGGATLSKRLRDIFEKAGMTTSEQRAGQSRAVVCYGAHSLRHHFVSAASAAGIPAPMIKAITGHTTDTMLEHYQQIGAGLVDEIARQLGGNNGHIKTLPPAQSPRLVDADAVLAIVADMTPKNCKAKREELMKLANKKEEQ